MRLGVTQALSALHSLRLCVEIRLRPLQFQPEGAVVFHQAHRVGGLGDLAEGEAVVVDLLEAGEQLAPRVGGVAEFVDVAALDVPGEETSIPSRSR